MLWGKGKGERGKAEGRRQYEKAIGKRQVSNPSIPQSVNPSVPQFISPFP